MVRCKKIKTGIIAACMAAMMCVSFVSADEVGEVPAGSESDYDKAVKEQTPEDFGVTSFYMADLEGEAGLTIEYTFDDGKTPVSGAKVGVIKIADLTVKNKEAKYTVSEKLAEKYPDKDFTKMTRDDFSIFAAELAALKLEPDKELVTDEKGKVTFENLDYGMYLVTENGKTGVSEKFFYFTPFIIQVPMPQIEDGAYNGEWLYKVESLPKTQLKAEMPTPTPPPDKPKTGDTKNPDMYLMAVIGGVLLVVCSFVFFRKETDDNE